MMPFTLTIGIIEIIIIVEIMVTAIPMPALEV